MYCFEMITVGVLPIVFLLYQLCQQGALKETDRIENQGILLTVRVTLATAVTLSRNSWL